jgi:hypothetical protein
LSRENIEAWVNVSTAGNWNRLHTHKGSAWSAVYVPPPPPPVSEHIRASLTTGRLDVFATLPINLSPLACATQLLRRVRSQRGRTLYVPRPAPPPEHLLSSLTPDRLAVSSTPDQSLPTCSRAQVLLPRGRGGCF